MDALNHQSYTLIIQITSHNITVSIQANFEMFLVDRHTGKPPQRYPRKYQPSDIADYIMVALIQGKPLALAWEKFKEE